jgi:hypothetical protein
LRAQQMADEFAGIDTRSRILEIIAELVADRKRLWGVDTLAAHAPRRAGRRS